MVARNETKFIVSAEDGASPALANITRGLQGMESQAGLATRALSAIGVTFSAAAVVSMVKGTIDASDGFNDLAQRVGISVKNLAGWTLAANQSGTSMESVAKGVKGLSTYMVDHGDKLRAAGITATDANGAMTQLADVFASMPDGIEKTALAVQLFGKAGMDMIPMLNMGSKGLAEAQEKAAEYGKRMAELAPDADRFNDQMEELALQSKIAGINMASLVTGPMAGWLEAQNEANRISGSLSESLRLFVFNLDAMTTEKPAEEIRRLTRALEEYAGASSLAKFVQSPTGFLFGGREEDLKRQIEFLKFLERQEAMAGAAKFGDYRDARDLSLANRGTMSVAEAMAKAAALRDKSASKAIRSIIGPDDVIYNIQESVRLKNRESIIGGQKEEDTIEARARAMDEAHMARMEMYRIATEGEEAERLAIGKTNGVIKETNNLAHDLGLTFSSAFEDAVTGGKKASEVLRALGADVQKIFLRKIVTEPLANAASKLFDNFDLSKFFGGARAGGGPVSGGTAYLVGEQGPELFMPGTSGSIVPNGAMGGGVNIVVNNTAAPDVTATASARNNNGAMEIEVIVQRAIAKDMARNGPITQSFGSMFNLARAV